MKSLIDYSAVELQEILELAFCPGAGPADNSCSSNEGGGAGADKNAHQPFGVQKITVGNEVARVLTNPSPTQFSRYWDNVYRGQRGGGLRGIINKASKALFAWTADVLHYDMSDALGLNPRGAGEHVQGGATDSDAG